ncbi:hypothetical protein [Natrinema limicola]|uniref:Uncharacterized protein n=1 Tax=Natrinema limicola JCM 13563 TaxID=1230457 RepID=M0C8I9_9EURY|nr:hypothetical protein [Natrinema limicola]ELZ19530.1 hypothetical protein C476_11866 [Natrinema limicola JCM 13563]
MVKVTGLVVAGAFVLFGGFVLSRARELHARGTTIDGVTSSGAGRLEPGRETTISGPVHVLESASPERTGPESEPTEGDPAALWAWRLRRKRNTGGQVGARWQTVDGELAVGEFTIDHGWEHVDVDAVPLAAKQGDDPFDSSQVFLGHPKTDVYLGDLDPINRFLERTGLADEGGIIGDLEVSVSIGRKNSMPDKYQATVVRDGDELLVRGEVTETADGYVLRGTDETPLVIASGDLEAQRERVQSQARIRAVAGSVLVVLGLVAAVAVFL